MNFRIDENDVIQQNIKVSRGLVGEALFTLDKEEKAKKLFIAYKGLEKVLRILGFDPQEKNKN